MQGGSSARVSVLAAGSLAVLLVVACSSAGTGTTHKETAANAAATAASATRSSNAAPPAAAATSAASSSGAAPATAAAAGGSIPDASGGAAADLGRKIIRNADLGLVVGDVEGAFTSISSIATGFGGYISGSNLAQSGEKLRGTVTLRVPASAFDQAMAQIKNLGVKVQRENITSQDVTEEYADLDARVANLQATSDQLRALLATIREKTNNANDILTVYRELTDINGQIEQAKGRQQYLTKLSDLATLSVELIPQEAPAVPAAVAHKGWSAADTFRDAARVLGDLGRGSASALIWIGVIGLPFAAIVALLCLTGLAARRRWPAARRVP